jgi:hypothetical protein
LIKKALCLDDLHVRTFAFSVVALLSIAGFAQSETAEPRFRPALIGNRPKALVNVIDTKRLIEKGQRDGLLMFTCYVSRSGRASNLFIDRETPGSKLLKEQLEVSFWDPRFIPAIYNGERTDVFFAGTMFFS